MPNKFSIFPPSPRLRWSGNFQFSKLRKLFLVLSVLFLLAAGCNNPRVSLQPVQEQTQRQQIQVTQKVATDFSDALFNFYADENKTALDLLKIGHKVETKTFSGIGEFVESINGTKADKHFWEFIVNGKSSNVGAGSYKPVNGDKIEWKLSEIK